MGVDRGEAVAVLVQRVADGVRAVPEGGVEDLDVLSTAPARSARSSARTSATTSGRLGVRSVIERPPSPSPPPPAWRRCRAQPRMDRPTGSPPTCAPGRLTCGRPVRPPCAARQVMRARSGSSVASGRPFSGAGNGVVGRQRIVPRRQRAQASRARASARISAAHWRSLSGIAAREGEVAGDAPRHARVVAIDPLLEREPRLAWLQRALGPRPADEAGRGHDVSPGRAPPARPGGAPSAAARRRSPRRPGRRRPARHDEPRGQRRRDRLAEQHLGDAGEGLARRGRTSRWCRSSAPAAACR